MFSFYVKEQFLAEVSARFYKGSSQHKNATSFGKVSAGVGLEAAESLVFE